METYLKENLLGKVFICFHSYREPDVVQVVGWTKNAIKEDAKVRNLYVRKVEFNATYNNYGGFGTINKDDIKELEEKDIQRSAKKNTCFIRLDPIEEGKELSLSKSKRCAQDEVYYHLVEEGDLDKEYKWCQY